MSQVIQHTSLVVTMLHNVVPKICDTMGGDRSSQVRKSHENPCAQRHLITSHLNIWREQEKKKAGTMWDGNKKLDSLCLNPYHTPCIAVPEAWVQLEPLKGQRGSFGRQPSLAPSSMRRMLMAAAHYSIFPASYVTSFFVSSPSIIASSPVEELLHAGEPPVDLCNKGYKLLGLMMSRHLPW
jgi:hypothetical protein